jgi:hypothetical protein
MTAMRRISMLWRLARRGAWYGFGKFSGTFVWGLFHHHCRQCELPKEFGCSPNCERCQVSNLLTVLFEPDDDLCDHGIHLDEDCEQCESEIKAITSLMGEQ